MFGCWGFCSETICVKDKSGVSTTYYIRDRLDKGGFSTIELVSPKNSRRYFVLKRILCHSKTDEGKASDEACLHMNLPSHSNILPCLATGRSTISRHPQGAISQVLMVLPYCERGTLQHEFDRRQRTGVNIPPHLVARMAIGVCRALSVLLSLDTPLCHRDVKPGNVLLFENWRPVLIDFGSCTPAIISISTFKDSEKWKDFAAENCSMTYRAPELFQPPVKSQITEKADIWSLGCLLYALCFLESPLDHVHSRGDSVALAACSANFQFLTDDSNKLAPGMMQLIKSTLSVDPVSRPSLEQIESTLKALEPSVVASPIDDVVFSNQPLPR